MTTVYVPAPAFKHASLERPPWAQWSRGLNANALASCPARQCLCGVLHLENHCRACRPLDQCHNVWDPPALYIDVVDSMNNVSHLRSRVLVRRALVLQSMRSGWCAFKIWCSWSLGTHVIAAPVPPTETTTSQHPINHRLPELPC